MYNRIKDLREDRDLFQKDISNILNITQRNYSYLETGKSDIPTDVLIKLAMFYNVSVDYILGITDIQKPYPRTKRKDRV